MSDQSLASTLRDGILIVDVHKQVVYANPAACQIWDLTTSGLRKHPDFASISQNADLKIDIKAAEKCIDLAFKGQVSSCSFSQTQSPGLHYEAQMSQYMSSDEQQKTVVIAVHDITPLYLEKLKLTTMINHLQDGVVMVDKQGIVVEANTEWQIVFDINQSPVGLPIFTRTTSAHQVAFDTEVREILERVMLGQRSVLYLDIIDTGRHIQVSFGPVVINNEVIGAMAAARDVTALTDKTIEAGAMATKAQRHLRELSQLAELSAIVGFNLDSIYQKYVQKIANLLDSTSVGIYIYEPNQQLLQLASNHNQTSHLPSTFSLNQHHVVTQAFAGRKPIITIDTSKASLALPIIHHSKSLGVIIVSREHTYDDHDLRLLRLAATRLAVICENATLYNDVNARRERWEAVFRFTEEGIVIFDQKGTIVGFNPASTTITGYQATDAIGKAFGKVIKTVGPETANAGIPTLEQVLKTGTTITNSEQLIENRLGNRIWTEISYSPIFDDSDVVTSGIAIIRDTTKDREVEEIKSDFISIVSHELRTPLTAIKGFLSMTLKQDFGELSAKQFHYLSRVYQSNQRMIDLVEDLMDATYIESGKISLTIAPISMDAVVNEVVAELAAKGAAKQVLINIRRRSRLPLVLADETRLHQIILNLIDNAIKYSPNGTEVDITCKVQGIISLQLFLTTVWESTNLKSIVYLQNLAESTTL
ncbi:PAS domain S-box protein [bacterium]|nr:MAG: PAS domain S-box protein [bacterium]